MIVSVDGIVAHASTGGVPLTGEDPVVVFIHGAGMNATIWQLQSRFIAYRGYRCVCVDLPGHGRSEGSALTTVNEMAGWVLRFLDAAGFEEVHVVGHSMGTFVALELARRAPQRVSSLTLCGTATAMPVHPDLVHAADHDLPAAAALMAAWGHARPAHVGTNPAPGMWMLGGAQALVETARPGVLGIDLRACQNYRDALVAAADVICPTTVVIGLGDKMTPPKSSRALAAALQQVTVVELVGIGHSMMSEDPRAVKRAILSTIAG